jgi:hypothetical protein
MDQPDPTQAASLGDLAWCLRHLRTLADTPTYRELERRTIHAEGMLPGTDLRRIPLKRATIADVLAGAGFPPQGVPADFRGGMRCRPPG